MTNHAGLPVVQVPESAQSVHTVRTPSALHRKGGSRSLFPLFSLFLLLMAGSWPALAGIVVQRPIGPGTQAALRDARTIYLECSPPTGDAAQAFFADYLIDAEGWKNYRGRLNVAVPLMQLNWKTRRAMFEALFPHDYADHQGWWHTVTYAGAGGQEDWSGIALWFTGSASNRDRLRNLPENKAVSNNLQCGTRLLIPRAMLNDVMRVPTPKPPPPLTESAQAPSKEKASAQASAQTPVAPPAPESVAPAEEDEGEDGAAMLPEDMQYESDAQGQHAVYRLKKGEALYTAVVVRFTDIRGHKDILDACELVAKRSGIRDVTDIDAGAKIRIPLDMLADRFQPEGSERRREYEDTRAEADRLGQERVTSHDLEGIVVVLDAGHGGRDYGAANTAAGLYEDELAYDIMCRVKALLEAQTRARLYMTIEDSSQGYKPTDAKSFSHDTDEHLLTTPHYPGSDAKVAANLRWYLANALYRKEKAAGQDDRKIVFVSIHCDMLFNEKLRGAMVYIPGAAYRRESEEPSGAEYARYAETKGNRKVETTAAERRRDEALSLNLAKETVDCLRAHNPKIKVHSASDPIRNVIRQSGGRAYVPAVLRNCIIPTKILVEVGNINNAQDRERMSDPQWRQWFAEALVSALKKNFD